MNKKMYIYKNKLSMVGKNKNTYRKPLSKLKLFDLGEKKFRNQTFKLIKVIKIFRIFSKCYWYSYCQIIFFKFHYQQILLYVNLIKTFIEMRNYNVIFYVFKKKHHIMWNFFKIFVCVFFFRIRWHHDEGLL